MNRAFYGDALVMTAYCSLLEHLKGLSRRANKYYQDQGIQGCQWKVQHPHVLFSLSLGKQNTIDGSGFWKDHIYSFIHSFILFLKIVDVITDVPHTSLLLCPLPPSFILKQMSME